MIYLASPYSHDSWHVRETRYLNAVKACEFLLAQRRWVYSPIVHCHELAKMVALPGDFGFWKDYNFAMLSRCETFMILRIEGWETSKGVSTEKAEAERLQIKVEYL